MNGSANGSSNGSATQVKTTSAMPRGNPKDSMKSTWRNDKTRQTWTLHHWFYEVLHIHPTDSNQDIPVFAKTEKVRYLPDWMMHRWVIVQAMIPLLIQQAYCMYTGKNFTALQASLYYIAFFNFNAIRHLWGIKVLAHQVGFLDGDEHERDGVPDIGVAKVVHSLISTSITRPVMSVILSYNASQTPFQMSWGWLFLEAGLYGIILDFWFYVYHRIMHESETLWKYHRTHHLTKHPNPLLTLYADHEQEFWDIAGIPLLTYFSLKAFGLPMGFYEWWICHEYVVFAELAGHSGLRIHASPPNTLTPLLKAVGGELVIEDHDIHHRKGWKHSGNYGKQTRLWDLIFGTLKDRVECTPENVDYENPAWMPAI